MLSVYARLFAGISAFVSRFCSTEAGPTLIDHLHHVLQALVGAVSHPVHPHARPLARSDEHSTSLLERERPDRSARPCVPRG
jgi:hypothetical protein